MFSLSYTTHTITTNIYAGFDAYSYLTPSEYFFQSISSLYNRNIVYYPYYYPGGYVSYSYYTQ